LEWARKVFPYIDTMLFGDLLSGTMDMVGKLTETIGSVTAGL